MRRIVPNDLAALLVARPLRLARENQPRIRPGHSTHRGRVAEREVEDVEVVGDDSAGLEEEAGGEAEAEEAKS